MQDFFEKAVSQKIPNQFIAEFDQGIQLYIKREDLLHPEVSGNKFRKLKYNLIQARQESFAQLLTFGGAHSNHIAATAAAGQLFRFKTIGIIRGEELETNKEKWSPTLRYAESCGMKFVFISREKYREKKSAEFIEKLKAEFGNFYLLPEGGTNELAIRGCSEILQDTDEIFDFICASAGTGGTVAGLIKAATTKQKVLGFSALISDHLGRDISEMVDHNRWELNKDYHFGGYAKVNAKLIDFINDFSKKYKIYLDPIYTGKLVFGIFDLIKSGYFPKNSKILAIHTGGLQGIEGMNQILKRKKLPQIVY
ncbi:1-aminocyclopropane-1-carboxylate deaminase/D-cysteine desulfhydrase [Christiangramia sabulilitoris]|uniref:1-aminocyclopropane-1-carboxylate deaminase/D-cysteine desulfhydrase n=1 Tax=Christiangramia sabulilitoris TaxID=2583991 RepID=A0A550HZN8_9FLAO|nr:pyridoxal-phosphate dependent enzyme [Christiangramia sabulilitoris]TRO64181.1 1-aminocyclopropane-1-carboxylate deaminase/D-cysteine desulfhydrase [Christiangramia sabulilitoris]